MAIGQMFSQRFSYALHALAYIATKPAGELTTLPELAEWMSSIWPNSSDTYLSNVVQRMARGRLLRSHRGIAGGYSLGRAATAITIRDVVELLEGVDVNRCSLSLEDQCPVMGRCAIQRKLSHLEMGFLKSLESVTIAELAKDLAPALPKEVRERRKRLRA
ncbi:MAG: Rrf2 family transcriptional regulator [Planctomycetes bacterium]|nr:Rrf2 family transcriptional regulator [Planctomycetota bacterium]